MRRYFFILCWPDKEHDNNDGTPLPGENAARDHAQRIIRELKEAGGYDDPGSAMIVKSVAGRDLPAQRERFFISAARSDRRPNRPAAG